MVKKQTAHPTLRNQTLRERERETRQVVVPASIMELPVPVCHCREHETMQLVPDSLHPKGPPCQAERQWLGSQRQAGQGPVKLDLCFWV